jgi:hypothetical protein
MDRVVELSGIVQYARRVTEQYKAAGRTVHPERTPWSRWAPRGWGRARFP